MKIITLCLLLFSSLIFANDLRISKANDANDGCNLYVANFDSKNEFLHFFEELQKIAKSQDNNAFAKKVLFPMHINGKEVQTLEQFNQTAKKHLSATLYDKIAKQEVSKLFCNYQGVMIDDGIVWIGKRKKDIGIISINSK